MTPSRKLWLGAVVLLGATTASGPVAASVVSPAQSRAALVVVSPAVTAPGERVLVRLEGWPKGPVTVGVCGNAARRASQDCDQIGAQGEEVDETGVLQFRLVVTEPPVGCPCVVRVTTTSGDVVRAAPIELDGVPGGVHIDPPAGTPTADTLRVSVLVESKPMSWPRSWYPVLAGPSARLLVVRLYNRGSSPVSGVRIVGAVGHDRTSGEPISASVKEPLQPGEARTVRVPFELAAPAWGHYVVSGSVYGLEAPVTFSVRTANDPWGLELAAIAILLILAQLARRRERKERAAQARAAAAAAELQLLPEGSPLVGAAANGHWASSSYDPNRGAGAGVPRANGNGRVHPHPVTTQTTQH